MRIRLGRNSHHCKRCIAVAAKGSPSRLRRDRRDKFLADWYKAVRGLPEFKEWDRRRVKRWAKSYYASNQEELRAYSRERYRVNREDPDYVAKERRRDRERDRIRYPKRKEYIAEKCAQWFKDNPSKVKVYGQRHRARKHDLLDTLTAQEWQHCLDYFGNQCVACGLTESLEADHWIPLSFEGENPGTVAENMIPLCQNCNRSKSNAEASEWLDWKHPDDRDLILQAVAFYFESL